MKTTIVYHQVKSGTDCPDGICAAWVTVRALNLREGEYELISLVHLNNEEYLSPKFLPPFNLEGDIYMLDFAYPESIMRSIAHFTNLVAIDHHKNKSFINNLIDEGLTKGVFDIAECGATAAWQYFYGNGIVSKLAMPWFLPYVRERDTGANGYYQGEIPESEAIGEAMSSRRHQFGTGEQAFAFFDGLCGIPKSELIQEGLPKVASRNEAIDDYLDRTKLEFMDVAGDRVPYFNLLDFPNLHRHYSMVGARAAIRHKQYPFVAVTIDNPSKISLRSCRDGGADVSLIAKALGGDGHENAAGYSL